MSEQPEQRTHFSKDRGRFLREGDYITLSEACYVLAANRGGEGINRDTASSLMSRWGVKKIDGPLYLYDDIRDRVVKRQRGRRALDNPSPGALRQRKLREKRRQADSSGPAIILV